MSLLKPFEFSKQFRSIDCIYGYTYSIPSELLKQNFIYFTFIKNKNQLVTHCLILNSKKNASCRKNCRYAHMSDVHRARSTRRRPRRWAEYADGYDWGNACRRCGRFVRVRRAA